MDLGLDEHVIVVTGATSGVGLATARVLVAEGAVVGICARDQLRLDAVASELTAAAPGRVEAVRADVRSSDEVDAFLTTVAERFGRIDGLVNNAGGSRMSTFATTTDDDWRDELDLKFSSVLNPVRAALPWLERAPHPAIVNINAILARQPEPRLVATSAARAGVLNLSRSLATELAPIRVNSVCLGLIDTGQWRRRFEDSGTDLTYDEWCRELAADRGVLLGRLGRAEEVAGVVAAVLSPVISSFVTGSTIDVAGGVGRYV
jgi:NAD(P)-dependent dehydrogenase (short-subunit alcohol dehydrogenase family)